jgi:hypothetical protein
VTAPGGTHSACTTWLILTYRLPGRSGEATAIRRRLAALGAVYPANAAVPASPAGERAFRRLWARIRKAGGVAQVLRAEVLEGGQHLTTVFNAAREQEYGQVISGCAELAARVQAMTAAGHFGYAELGEMDAELKRLLLLCERIRTRDVLAAANAGTAESSLARCYALLDELLRGFTRQRLFRSQETGPSGRRSQVH